MNELQMELVQKRVDFLEKILEERRNDFKYGQAQLIETRKRIDEIKLELAILYEGMKEVR